VAFYTILMTVVYALIPYKTPWCVLGFLHGMALMAGVGVVALLRWLQHPAARVLAILALLCGTGHLAWQARQTTTGFEVSQSNPYVYAHPVRDVVRLGDYIERLADVAPAGRGLPIQVIADNCWPLPWYLRRMEHVGYPASLPDEPHADVVIVSQALRGAVEEKLRDEYRANAYGLRPDEVVFVYVRHDLRAEFERQARRRTATGNEATRP
jgi:predicted membrane-bound mannosyltransferase